MNSTVLKYDFVIYLHLNVQFNLLRQHQVKIQNINVLAHRSTSITISFFVRTVFDLSISFIM